MTKYFRADGLRVDGNPVTVLKKTNLPFVGATWSYYEGIVWHLSEEAMDDRLDNKRFGARVFKLKVSEIEFIVFHGLQIERRGLSDEVQQRYEKLDKHKYSPYLEGNVLKEEDVSHECGKFS